MPGPWGTLTGEPPPPWGRGEQHICILSRSSTRDRIAFWMVSGPVGSPLEPILGALGELSVSGDSCPSNTRDSGDRHHTHSSRIFHRSLFFHVSVSCDKLPDRGRLGEREGLFCLSVSKKRPQSSVAGDCMVNRAVNGDMAGTRAAYDLQMSAPSDLSPTRSYILKLPSPSKIGPAVRNEGRCLSDSTITISLPIGWPLRLTLCQAPGDI